MHLSLSCLFENEIWGKDFYAFKATIIFITTVIFIEI